MEYKVSEIFLSLQGEGYWTGTPMCFVRLWGCNLDCVWCDTFQGEVRRLSDGDILDTVRKLTCDTKVERVCLTGGEPTCQDLIPLSETLCDEYLIHLETNGTRMLKSEECISWVTVSPKFPPGLDRTVQHWGNELKVPVWSGIIDKVIRECATWGHFEHRFLQPVDGPEIISNAERCLRLSATEPRWRVSMQGHKRIGVR